MGYNKNLLLMTDVYKLGHLRQYKPGTTKVYSYLCARSTKKYNDALFFGLQPYLKLLETKITKEDAEEFFSYYTMILGAQPQQDIVDKINGLVELGYLPLEIKAVPEGTIINNKNVLATVTNTHPDFYWVVGFFESLLLKVWAPTTVATKSLQFKRLVSKYTEETSDSGFLLPFLVHDFGYRGVSSEETAEICGAAHLVNFCGTDTVPAVKFMKEVYAGEGLIGASVPATEHSIHCSFGPSAQDEIDYVTRQMELNPTGLMSVVSDAYDYWRMLTVTLPTVKEQILARDGKYVVRPDSGDPESILCGTAISFKTEEDARNFLIGKINSWGTLTASMQAVEIDGKYYYGNWDHLKEVDGGYNIRSITLNEVIPTPEMKGTFRILGEQFGSSINSKGFKELNPKIGVIYGDGMYYERYEKILNRMKDMGYANTNLVVGIGGLLLQQHNRDDLGFAFKATYAEINGEACELYKDPITDPGKKSHKGLMALCKQIDGKYVTVDQVDSIREKSGELVTVFKDGKTVKEYTLQEIRNRSEGKV
jgi:nicotinic acid phosphoribosyltransferase